MFKHDDDYGGLITIGIVIMVIGVIIYAVVALSMIIFFAAGAAGSAYGGGTALVNYVKAFKENVIDSNREENQLPVNN